MTKSEFEYIFMYRVVVNQFCFQYGMVIMAGTLKLFQTARRLLQNIGIYPQSQSKQINPFNSKNLAFVFCLIIGFFGVFGYFIFQAKTKIEFNISFYAICTMLTVIAVLIINILKAANIFSLMGKADEFIERSKQNNPSLFCKNSVKFHKNNMNYRSGKFDV